MQAEQSQTRKNKLIKKRTVEVHPTIQKTLYGEESIESFSLLLSILI